MGFKDGLKQLGKVLLGIAPTMATVLTAGNPLAGMAVRAVASQFGGADLLAEIADKDDSSAAEIVAKKIQNADVEDLIRLKNVDLEFVKAANEAGYNLKMIDHKDRQGARDMRIKTGDKVTNVIAFIFLGIFMTSLGWLLYILQTSMGVKLEIDSTLIAIVSLLLGVIVSSVKQIINFFFGSSAGSKSKDIIRMEEMKTLINNGKSLSVESDI